MRIPSSANAHGPALTTRMVLLFMASSAGILGLTAIFLFLDPAAPGSGPARAVLPVMAALVAIGLVAYGSYIVTTSITRPLAAILEFTRSISEGRLDGRLTVTGSREAVVLAVALNALAESLRGRISRIDSIAGVLASIDDTLENSSGQLLESAVQRESAVERTAGLVEGIRESTGQAAEGVERLESSTGKTAGAIQLMTAGFENVSVSTETLANSFQEVDSSITELTEAGRRIGSGIVSLLDASSATATAISQMDANIRRVKKNALDASSISEGVKTDAATGKRAVEESIAGMRAIRDSSAITAEVVKDLSLRVKDIGTILSVIDELAEQTDLLALNATIIAAQAGEQGKGFAVVADEIRELAERTSSSTREIASVIGGVQDETRRAVDAINLAEASISEGEKLAQHSGTALEKIVTGVEQASIQVNQIARAAAEQAHGSQSIRGGIERVAELIDQIAASAAEQTKTCQRIAAAIERMKHLAFQVRSAADQGQTSALISRQSGEISDMLEQLRLAGRSQLLGCAMLFRTLDDSRSAAVSDTRTARDTGSTINGLSKQIHLLEKELTGFRL